MRSLSIAAVVLLLAGCASTTSPTPILASTPHLERVGQEQAGRDILQCKALAEKSFAAPPAEQVAIDTAMGGRRGEAMGTTPGGGGVSPGVTSVTPSVPSREPAGPVVGSANWKNLVDRCLRERGYQVSGWQ
jgi:hypothetical protein